MSRVNHPKISVILPAYNASKYIVEAIESILSQSFSDFELLIINDGSTDDTEEKVLSISDTRIEYIKNEQNIGLANTLNKGMNLAKGEYIARMDADDISLPARFQVQVDFLDNHEDFILCSTAIKTFGAGEEKVIMATSCSEQLKIDLLFSSNVAHPAVMFRRKEFIDNNLYYKQEECPAEDYALWTRVVFVGKIYNIPEVLLHYRIHPNQVTAANQNVLKSSCYVREEYIKRIAPEISRKYVEVFIKTNISNIDSYDKWVCIARAIDCLLAQSFLSKSRAINTLKRYHQNLAYRLLLANVTLSFKDKIVLFLTIRFKQKVKLIFHCK